MLMSVKLHEMAAEHEQQTCEVERQQTTAMSELMDETYSRLSKMQADYDQLLQSTVITIIISDLLVSQLPQLCVKIRILMHRIFNFYFVGAKIVQIRV